MKMNLKLPVIFLKENKRFVAYSPIIDLSTSGKTLKEAQKKFTEAALIFFEEITNNKTIDNVLTDLGWHKIKTNWHPPVIIGQENKEVAVAL